MNKSIYIFISLILLAVISVFASPISADPGGNGNCSAGGGVYAENTPSTGHEGFGTYCAAGNKAVANTATEPSPYCWVRTWDDCLRVQGISSSPPVTPPSYTPPVVQPPVCQSSGSCTAPQVCGQTTYGTDNCGMPCTRSWPACPAPQPAPVVQPASTVTQQQTSQNTNNNQNNNNNDNRSSSQATAIAQGGSVTIHSTTTREIIREVPAAPQRVQAQPVQQPQRVVYVPQQVQPRVVQVSGAQEVAQVKELPKTGLPVAGLLLSALLPIGWKMKRFGSSVKDEVTATYLWEDRQSRLG